MTSSVTLIAEMLTFIVLFAGHMICGLFSYGITKAYFTHNPQKEMSAEDQALIMGFGGYFGLLVAILGSRFVKHGLQFKDA